MKKTATFFLSLLLLTASLFSQCFQSANTSKNGIFIIEVESVEAVAGWTIHQGEDFTGRVSYEWTGEDYFGEPGRGLISYPVHIKDTGIYTFYWYSKVGKGEDPTEHNDTWLRFPDASATFAVKAESNDTIRPHGICEDDCPNGTGGAGWYKMYSSNTIDWTWTSRTSDHDAHEIRVQYDEPGLYHIEISGRSNGHIIDKMILFPHRITLKDALLR